MADPARAARLAQRIKVIIAEALRSRVKDERAELITVTDSRVTNDLQHATVYYTVLEPVGDRSDRQKDGTEGSESSEATQGSSTSRRDVEEVLAANRGTLRYEMGRQLNIRLTPTLEFVLDEIPEHAEQLEDVLRKAREQDEKVRKLREGAEPVSESPYRSDAAGSSQANAEGDRPASGDR